MLDSLALPAPLPVLGGGDTTDDRPPLAAIIAQHRHELLARARQLCRGHLDPEDVVQDALVRAWKGWDSLREPGKARSWLLTVLTNTFIDRLRQVQAQPPSDPIDEVPVAAPEPGPRPLWASIGVDELRAAVDRLPPELGELYRLHALEGLDYNQLVARLGVNKSTVGTRLLRARKLLRDLLSEGVTP